MLKVKYVGGMDFYDGLTTGGVYEVIGENSSQYIVNNDLNGTSTIKKSKFEVINLPINKTIKGGETLKLQDLNEVFEEAREVNANYIGMIVLPSEEAIIFSNKVFDYKQEYINNVYNEDLQLKNAKHVQIIDCAYSKTYHDIQVKLKR